jgi:hypothetical protein
MRRHQKKPNAEPRQKPKHAVIDPLVDPGNPPHRHQTRTKADSTGPYHRMVILAKGSPGRRPARALQRKKTTVMLGHGERTGAADYGVGFPVPMLKEWIDRIGV